MEQITRALSDQTPVKTKPREMEENGNNEGCYLGTKKSGGGGGMAYGFFLNVTDKHYLLVIFLKFFLLRE